MSYLTTILLCSIIFLIIVGCFLFYFLFKRQIKLRWYRWRYKQNFIRAVIVYANNQAKEVYTQIMPDMRIKDGKTAYLIVSRCVINLEKIPTSFYSFGNPNPWSFESVMDLKVRLNSENFDLAMSQKIIKDILTENINLKIIMILLGILCILCLIILLRVMKVIKLKGET